MDTNDTEKITIALANEFLNSFNINGLLEAAKQYSIQLAKEKISNLSEEEKEGLLKDVNERENSASNSATSNEVTTENPEKELEPA
tara:strand:- start:1258 stop:1515 length:258 start_codon:yes stop_codon:yes gene_type:complete